MTAGKPISIFFQVVSHYLPRTSVAPKVAWPQHWQKSAQMAMGSTCPLAPPRSQWTQQGEPCAALSSRWNWLMMATSKICGLYPPLTFLSPPVSLQDPWMSPTTLCSPHVGKCLPASIRRCSSPVLLLSPASALSVKVWQGLSRLPLFSQVEQTCFQHKRLVCCRDTVLILDVGQMVVMCILLLFPLLHLYIPKQR